MWVPPVCLLIVANTPNVPPDHRAPTFDEYSVNEAAPGDVAPADLDSHPAARRYRTLLRRAERDKPNFAGHFNAIRIGCGTSCAFMALIDRRTGRVFFPMELGTLHWSMWDADDYGYSFKVNSRLVRGCGAPGETGRAACRYYEWTGASARLVAVLRRR